MLRMVVDVGLSIESITVRSAYEALCPQTLMLSKTQQELADQGADYTILWKKLSTLKLPPSTRTFIWRWLHRMLPIVSALKFKCILCSTRQAKVIEGHEHMAFECEKNAKLAQKEADDIWQAQHNVPLSWDLVESRTLGGPSVSQQEMALRIATIHSSWMARNNFKYHAAPVTDKNLRQAIKRSYIRIANLNVHSKKTEKQEEALQEWVLNGICRITHGYLGTVT